MIEEYSYHDRRDKLSIELKKCSSNYHYKNLIYHACQAKYEYESGIEVIEMK